MKKEGIKRGIAVLLTLGVLVTLLLAGPAEAVILKLEINQANIEKGKPVTFFATADVESGEHLDVDYFTLKLTGNQATPEIIECKFDIDGTPIGSGCGGLVIEKISSPPQNGYGYYVEGKFKFKITLDTSSYPTGTYQTYLIMSVGGVPNEKQGEDITITPVVPPVEMAGCSIRAKDGTVTVDGVGFDKPTINFHIPLGNAGNGKGTLNAQSNKKRLSYRFNIMDVTANDANQATIMVKGDVEINGSIKQKGKVSTITYNKISRKISLVSTDNPADNPQLHLEASNMPITFQKWC